ncbi:hypothetical protein M0D21_07020 [Aquimarina sp. D1M17]|uniref:hypothetical protein n=1 Tax=Aquimarina acroporae TaxID=2937283 RepID=UPI0020BF5460|nr:hypothetical protein [Aquimarina acroporae]MCK8521310.1 hypothetical protein [Aquimarina acroporae]
MKEICSVAIGNDYLEDRYTFYSNGMIQHMYDESIFNYGLMDWVQPGDIDNYVKRRILKKCENKHKKSVRQILAFNLRMN